MKKFESIEYKGGHPKFPKPCKANLEIDQYRGTIKIVDTSFLAAGANVIIEKENVVNVSFEEKAKRSAGKTAAGAIIGGVLTGGIGLLVGGAIGAMRKDISNIYLTINYNNREYDVILKAGSKAAEIYGAIAAAI